MSDYSYRLSVDLLRDVCAASLADVFDSVPVWWAQIRPGPDSAKRIRRLQSVVVC